MEGLIPLSIFILTLLIFLRPDFFFTPRGIGVIIIVAFVLGGGYIFLKQQQAQNFKPPVNRKGYNYPIGEAAKPIRILPNEVKEITVNHFIKQEGVRPITFTKPTEFEPIINAFNKGYNFAYRNWSTSSNLDMEIKLKNGDNIYVSKTKYPVVTIAVIKNMPNTLRNNLGAEEPQRLDLSMESPELADLFYIYNKQLEAERQQAFMIRSGLEQVVSNYIIEKNKARYAPGNIAFEVHHTYGIEAKGKGLTLYLETLFHVYNFKDGTLELQSGGRENAVIEVVKTSAGNYEVKSYKNPRDGALWDDDIKSMFPSGIVKQIFDNQEIVTKMKKEMEDKVAIWLKQRQGNNDY